MSEDMLTNAFCGRTATVDAEGFPYVVPNLFVWHERSVWLHTARGHGHFFRNVTYDDRVCFEIDEPGEIFPYGFIECDTSVSYRSIVLFGRIQIVSDAEKARVLPAVEDQWPARNNTLSPQWGKTRGPKLRDESVSPQPTE